MQKNSSIAASSRFNEQASKSSATEDKRAKRKTPYKIQICNQDLEEAIREVRTNVRDNPEWRLNLRAVVSQYPPSKQRKPVNDSQRMDGFQQQLPISERLVFPTTTQTPQTNFDKLKFTERKRIEFEARTKEIKQRRMQLEVSLLEKQMKAKLQRKISENLKLKEKRQMIREIEQHREDSLRMHEIENNRRKMESSLLHESNVANVKMIRKSRSRSHRQFISQQKSRSDESAVASHFKDIQMSKSKLQKRQIILSRYKSLRCASQGSLHRRGKPNIVSQV